MLCGAGHRPRRAAYRTRLCAALADLKEASGASPVIVMRQLPTFDSGEITEEGSLNARLIREPRTDGRGALSRHPPRCHQGSPKTITSDEGSLT
jgi:hypothetical protein